MKLLFFESYLETIKKGIDTKMFQSLWAEIEGRKVDITESGRFSCALFVSGVLMWFGLIKERHATVKGTIEDMIKSGWYEIKKPKIGCILRWEAVKSDGSLNEHLGFYVGGGMAISNDKKKGTPVKHHWTYGEKNGLPKRKIINIYWHPKLDSKYFV